MGMINYDTILSAYDDKLTLMQWLKKVEKALNEAAATSFKVNKKGNATISFSIVFEDGSEIESGDIVLQQGESVAAGRIENGHLILTLTNGDELDAGNLFNGNVNIVGDVSIMGNLSAGNITGNSIIENMAGYSFRVNVPSGYDLDVVYAGAAKNGNKITFAISYEVTKTSSDASNTMPIGVFVIPNDLFNSLVPNSLGMLDQKVINCFSQTITFKTVQTWVYKSTTPNEINFSSYNSSLDLNTKYCGRIEVTFLLGENLAA